jgi:TPR repeat protein
MLAERLQRAPTRDETETTDVLLRACDLGANRACLEAARALVDGRGRRADAGRAARLLEGVCDRGLGEACFELARLCIRGEGVPPDDARALSLESKACSLGYEAGCLCAARHAKTTAPRN